MNTAAQDDTQQLAHDANHAPVPHDPKQIPAPSQGHVSGPHKEHAPLRSPEPMLSPTVPDVNIPQELKERGVEESPDNQVPQIHPVVKQAGVTPAKNAVPVPTAPSGNVSLPMPVTQAQQLKKTASWKDSVRWLAELVLEQGKKEEYLQKKGE